MTDNDEFATDDGLEAFFEAGRADAAVPSADLLGRIMADAEAQIAVTEVVVPRPGLFTSLIEAIGGWPTLAGMATAGVVGVWVGFSQPAGLDMVAEKMLGTADTSYLVDLVPAFSADFEEG